MYSKICIAMYCLITVQAFPSGHGNGPQLVGVPDIGAFSHISYPKLGLIDLGESSHGHGGVKEIKLTRTIKITVPKPFPVKVPLKVPYPVPIDKPYPVHVTKLVQVPHPVPVEVIKSVPYPVEVPKPYPVPEHEFRHYHSGAGMGGGHQQSGGEQQGGHSGAEQQHGHSGGGGGEQPSGYGASGGGGGGHDQAWQPSSGPSNEYQQFSFYENVHEFKSGSSNQDTSEDKSQGYATVLMPQALISKEDSNKQEEKLQPQNNEHDPSMEGQQQAQNIYINANSKVGANYWNQLALSHNYHPFTFQQTHIPISSSGASMTVGATMQASEDKSQLNAAIIGAPPGVKKEINYEKIEFIKRREEKQEEKKKEKAEEKKLIEAMVAKLIKRNSYILV